ncbi:MAG: HEAT repeat domain-containing protein [Anaerolineae bacterium]|nr:HEAT repeat domain-containing protein [Anaerolineae bacterium]
MKDDSLIEDLKTIKHAGKDVEKLQQAGVSTYSQLLTLIGDETADTELRSELCYVLWWLDRYVDKRKAVGPLLSALRSKESELHGVAVLVCGMTHLKRTFPLLTKFATAKDQPEIVRVYAIQTLGMMRDVGALTVLKMIVVDETEDVGIRAHALEQTVSHTVPVEEYMIWLNDSHADLRFWAAYCLGGMRYSDFSLLPALATLDRTVATDHTVPVYWGWHVDREALLPYELIYYHKLHRDPEDVPYYVWIISPASEYQSFIYTYRHWTESHVYVTDETPPITLTIDRDWLSKQLQQRWADIRLNVREPRPQAYLLNFQLTLSGEMLIGGLHRDGYALVLTCVKDAVYEFAAWYRELFAAEQALFLYEWADVATSLTPAITAQEIRQVLEKRDEDRRA